MSNIDSNPQQAAKEYKDSDYKIGEWTIGCGQQARDSTRHHTGIQGVAVAFCTIGSPEGMSKGIFQGWYRCAHCHKDTDFSATFSFVGDNPEQKQPCAQCGKMNVIGCRLKTGTNPVSGQPLLDVFVLVRPESGTPTENAIHIASIETDLRAKTIEAAGDISRVIADLGTNNWPQAIKTLERIGEPVVLPLVALVTDDTADVKKRGLAASALGKIGDPRGTEALVVVLKNQKLQTNKNAVRNAIFALETAHDPRIAEALEPYLDDADQDVRKAAALVAEKHGIRRRQTAQPVTPSAPRQQPSNKGDSTQQTAKKIGCFVATACYGTEDAPEVLVLRRFRDEVLVCSAIGRWLIEWYYTVSPGFARYLSKHPVMAKAIRASILGPVVKWLEKRRE
jgi:hypothetical protein